MMKGSQVFKPPTTTHGRGLPRHTRCPVLCQAVQQSAIGQDLLQLQSATQVSLDHPSYAIAWVTP